MQSLRGVAHLTAATVVAELGNLARFENPRQLMGYSGLVPREHSSGNRTQRGPSPTPPNAHLRQVLIETAWAYRHRPAVNGRLLRRQKALTLSDETKRIAWKAQQRLFKRAYTAMMARAKHKNQVMTALAHELLGFLWAIAVQTEAQFKVKKAA